MHSDIYFSEEQNQTFSNPIPTYQVCSSQLLRASISSPLLNINEISKIKEDYNNSFEFTKSESNEIIFQKEFLSSEKKKFLMYSDQSVIDIISKSESVLDPNISNYKKEMNELEYRNNKFQVIFEKYSLKSTFFIWKKHSQIQKIKEKILILIEVLKNIFTSQNSFTLNKIKKNNQNIINVSVLSFHLNNYLLKKTFFKWKNNSAKTPNELKSKVNFLVLTLKNLIIPIKYSFFLKIVLLKQNLYYDSIIKNMLPLMQIHSLFSIKLKENSIVAFQRIKHLSKTDFTISKYKKLGIKNLCMILNKIIQIKKKDVFVRTMLFIYQNLKSIENFKENMKNEFLKINKKFNQLSKRQKCITSNKQKSIDSNYNSNISLNFNQILKISYVLINLEIKKKCFAWCKIKIFSAEISKSNIFIKNYPNRSNGTIKHLIRSAETNSLMNSKYMMKETLERSRDYSKNSDCSKNYGYNLIECNEELVTAINFLKNL